MEKTQYLEFVLSEAEALADQFQFTDRERQVLRIMVRSPELDLKTVAAELQIGVGTLRTHRRNIFIKTKSRSLDEFRMKLVEFILTTFVHRNHHGQCLGEKNS